MTDELQILIITISAISGFLSLMAGLIYGALLFRYMRLMHATHAIELPKYVKYYSIISTIITIGTGLFLIYRCGFVAIYGGDFEPKDWILFDLLVGINLFIIALRGVEDFKFRMKILLNKSDYARLFPSEFE